jgi:aspartate kinase
MELVVQKYGGTSLATAEQIKRVARRIIAKRKSGDQVVVVVSAMGNSTSDLVELARGLSSNPDPREMDLLLSTGEIVSGALTAMALKDLGCDSISLTGAQAGIHTDTTFGRARIAALHPERLQRELNQDRVVVVAGFQGVTDEMEVTTLGRGASDTTAVALAAGLGAIRCEIYTDVGGIYTADPRIVKKAQKLPDISYDEMLELASYGAKMHPRSIELGEMYQIPILVASAFNENPGTLIHGDVDMMELRNKVRGVACDLNVARITVLAVPDQPGIAASLFEPLAQAGISVDVIVQNASQEHLTDLSFTVAQTDLDKALIVVERVAKSIGSPGVVSNDHLGKVSIVGRGIQNAPGYASQMFQTLYAEDINIEMITTSEIRITCIVAESQAHDAVKALHRAFGLEEPS